jgi:Tfp pilus assembly protein PilO
MLWGMGLLVLVVVFYMFVYVPRGRVNADLATRLVAARADLTQLQAQAQRKDALQQQIAEMQSSIQAFQGKLPSAREIPTLLLQLDALAHQSGVDLRSIRPSALKPAVAPQPGTTGAPVPSITGQVGAAAPPASAAAQRPAGENAPSPLAGYQQFSVDIAAEGDFASLLKFAKGIEEFPRFLAISDLRLTPAQPRKGQAPSSTPILSMQISTTAYVAPAGGAR